MSPSEQKIYVDGKSQEGFLEEVGAWECFKEGGERQLGKFEIKQEALHRQNQAD